MLADAGVASRRACEALIEEGRVTVNGRRVTSLPIWVNPEEDRIEVDGERVGRPTHRVYVMLNKPARSLSTAADEPGAARRTVVDMVNHPSGARLFPVGRLDYETQGMILLTNDGDFANRLTHPSYGVAKTYRVVVRGLLDEAAVKRLERGIYLAERREGQTVGATRTARVEIALTARDRDRTVLTITLREGRNRQVRRMLAAVGCPVKKLERVAMGPVKLKGLARGEWRELTRDELRALRRASQPGGGGKGASGRAKPRTSPRGRSRRASAADRPSRGTETGRQGANRRSAQGDRPPRSFRRRA